MGRNSRLGNQYTQKMGIENMNMEKSRNNCTIYLIDQSLLVNPQVFHFIAEKLSENSKLCQNIEEILRNLKIPIQKG
ncbi:MAG: hypothetical protein ACTSUK_10675 [Promethearchaeota archaeon]